MRRDMGFDEGGADFWSLESSAYEDRAPVNDSGKKSCAKSKECRYKDCSLWNTERDGSWLRGVAVDADRLSAACEAG